MLKEDCIGEYVGSFGEQISLLELPGKETGA